MYIRERLPYWLSCDVRAHKFHERNLVFKDHCLSDQLEELCGITTECSVFRLINGRCLVLTDLFDDKNRD